MYYCYNLNCYFDNCIVIYKVDNYLDKNKFVLYYQESSGYLRKIKLKVNDVSKISDAINMNLGDSLEVDFKEKSDLDENLSDEEFKKVLDKRISLDIEPLLIEKEKVKVNDIKIKLSQIYESCCSFINYKNNYPEFESELFYFYIIIS